MEIKPWYHFRLILILSILAISAEAKKTDTPGNYKSLPDSASEQAQASAGEMSDLSGDGIVDFLDLDLFSNKYLDQDWNSVEWCTFYISSVPNRRYFRQITGYRTGRFIRLLDFITDSYGCQSPSQTVEKSDLNTDGVVDLEDLVIFSTNYLWSFYGTVDWCSFRESTSNESANNNTKPAYYLKYFRSLLEFINSYYNCGLPELTPLVMEPENEPRRLTRIASFTDLTDKYYITDAQMGSLFIYDANFSLRAEIKGLNKPLGVAVDQQGNILVGNNGRDNVEVYDSVNGELLAVFAEGEVKMPTAITVDVLGNIYVTDSKSHNVKVYSPTYDLIRVIGSYGFEQTELKFPIDTLVIDSVGEILVADQGNDRIQIYDLEGNWIARITFDGTPGSGCSWFTGKCRIPGVSGFTNLQALELDSLGRLHVLDLSAATVTVFDPTDGTFLGSYGEYGEGPGFLRIPMDLYISDSNTSVVLTGEADRIETFTITW
jgi:hypothetical protein